MSEQWKRVPGFSRYEASDEGRVRSYVNNKWGLRTVPKVMRPWTTRGGYGLLSLRDDDGQAAKMLVHNVVLLAFVGPRPADKPETRHRDGDPQNNRLDNIVYGTRCENAQDTLRHGRHTNAAKTHCKQGHEFTPENTAPRPEGGRRCRTCRNAAVARHYARSKARAA